MMRSTRPPQHGFDLHEFDTDRVSDAMVRKVPPIAKPVDGRCTYAEEFRDLSHGEDLANRPKGFVVRREAVQQGSSKILARACMGLHIFALLVGHASRACTGLPVLARN